MENLKVIRTSKQESLTREVELFKDEKQLAQNYINSEGFIFEEADLIPTNLKLDIEEINSKLNPKSDSESSIIIYESLKNLNLINASDKRLWTTLCHKQFMKYVQDRWPLKDTPRSIILSRWLFNGTDRTAFTRNAISRLWWAGHLTAEPWKKEPSLEFLKNDDPYKYTRIMTDVAQLWFDITEREWGGNLIYRICFLETFDRISKSKNISATFLSRELSKIFTGVLVADVVLVAHKEPQALIEYVEELTSYLEI